MKQVYDPVLIARQFLFVRELANEPNRGRRVESIQHWALGDYGDSWCDEFAAFVLDIAFQGESPFPRERDVDDACAATLAFARNMDWLAESPVRGDLVVSVDADGCAHHIGIYTGQVAPNGDALAKSELCVIAGNTDADGTSSNGDRVGEHAVPRAGKVYIHYPRE